MSEKGRFLNFNKKSKKPKRYSFSGKQGEWLSSSMFLKNSSAGKALQGIYLTKKLEDQLQVRAQILEVPPNAAITEATRKINYVSKEFSSTYQEYEYVKMCEVLGHSAAASISTSTPVYGDVAFGISASKGDERTLYLSTHKFTAVHHASYSFKGSDFTLSSSAKDDLGNISKMLQVQKADSSNVQEACKQFFLKYGSHANRGPISFGVGYLWKCFSKGFENSEIDTVKKMQSNVISNTSGLILTVDDNGGISEVKIQEKFFTNNYCSKKTTVNTHFNVTIKGGSLSARKGLVANKDTWIVIDRGDKLEAVWDIIKRNHNRELGDVIDVLKTTWESDTGLEAAPNSPLLEVGVRSLEHILEIKAELHESSHPQGEPVFSRNKSAHDLFKKLNLSKHYPMGLSQKEAICVRSRPLEFSLNLTNPTSFHDIPSLVLHKLMSYDHRCRSDLMPAKSRDDEDEEDSDDNETEEEKIHPVDILLAILICSDNFLRQDLFSRLAKCQLAVPFILPDPFTQQLSIPLWAMRSIIKDFKCIQDIDGEVKVVEKTCPIINYEMPIISFIRFGKHQKNGASKSKLLNNVISKSHYDHFFHRDCAGGRSEVLLGKGLVDMCWYISSGEPNDTFPDAITFLNLHGDARDYPQQSRFLSKISSMCFILLTEEDLKFDGETIKILKEFASSLGGITILNDTEKSPENLRSEISKVRIVKLAGKNESDVKHLIQKKIKEKLKAKNNDLKTLKNHCNCYSTAVQNCTLLIDEHSTFLNEGMGLAASIQNMVASFEPEDNECGIKETFLPLQGDLWQTWVSKNKEFYRQVYRGNKLVHNYTDEIKEEKQMFRQGQLKYVESLTPVMEYFIKILLNFERNYFLQCLKLGLSDSSRDLISALHQQYLFKKNKLKILQEKTNNGTYATKEQISECRAEMENIEKKMSDYFGLEHLLRELGQIYEAVSESSPIPGLSRLPVAAAELLIEGYPLELMDGDASHVPLRWVTAVITEVATKLGDPNVFVLSIVGLQSTGKSTMLNTVFGLSFNVSSGRCTRGAFMQLLPLDEQLRVQTSISYVLVVDTEGLCAPELDRQMTHKRDNELATFVIGLADVTLINIRGEVPGDMDDILQTSIHAFLRMSQVIKYRRSCQFIHQNTEPGTNTEVIRENFTRKLDKFTVDAAKEANVETQYKTFNDVIKFKGAKDIHHFPGLWTGAPPMAHVSQEYSIAAQKLKYHLIEILKEPRIGSMPLSSFKQKMSDLWEALLKENFVFSFKNTLEIIAYNSLETQYSQWEWEFREAMLKWEQTQENEITTAEANIVSELVDEKCEDLNRHIHKLYEDLRSEMDKFLNSSKQGEIQWKTRFESKLVSLSDELKIHAVRQCKNLGIYREANSKFENERNIFIEGMTKEVQELIGSLRQEQEELHDNLKRKKLEPLQLKKILDLNLFTPECLKLYREEIITGDQEESLREFIQDSEVPMSEQCLNCILVGEVLSTQQVISILNLGRQSEQELEAKFNSDWDVMLNKLSYVSEDPVNVEFFIESVLINYVKGYDIHYSTPLRKTGADLKLVVNDKHYGVKFKQLEQAKCDFPSTDPFKNEAQKKTDEVLEIARTLIDSLSSSESDFKSGFILELLKALDCEIDNNCSSSCGTYSFNFTQKYKFDVYLSACGYALVEFEKMAESFRKKKYPWLFYEADIKGPLFTRFKNHYYQRKAEEGIANSLCAHFEGPIKIQVRKSLSTTIIGQMKNSEHYFKSKMALRVKVLTDLYHENDFDSYMVYVRNVKTCLEEKLHNYIIKYCDEGHDLVNTRFQNLAKEEVSRLTEIIEVVVTESGGDETDFLVWLKTFCENVDIKRELGVKLNASDIISGYNSESIQTLNFNNVKLQIRKRLPNLHGIFDGINCESEMENWEVKPHEFLKELIGCTEQCPFCGEQCDLQDAGHAVNHRTAIHRSGCLGGFKDVHTQKMYIEFCQTKISCNEKFRNTKTEHKWVDYSKYQKIYPNWTITPDIASEDSLYWKLFIGKYKDQIADRFGAKAPDVPESWSKISWEQVEENLRKIYNL